MTTPGPRPRLKSLTHTPNQQRSAEPAPAASGRSAPKVAARQGALSALLPDAHPADQRYAVAWLHVIAPSDWRVVPRAISHCQCGRHVTALGCDDVADLIAAHTEHRTLCPLRATNDGRKAA
ncbi:hypothetical protein [Actinacidiphila bryophytorum]|uniref:Uncharacterized protein n=1 Tax=Actinacidiphila bryophytorum TaxID=1436133 RepID=A0A9W4H0H3_9ACTN|nr:hypothetical protein [Actinacidiphila bryophytorum]MBM9438735.1 hypothetical protein [Actinacidiphila bryophytorum]MBN6546021.1 hypothetical protein [Actinacidiphila bryophytorum]CAG7637697.1 conserved hypothetical protein [Actinacidiphila bryophytorum]